MRITAFGSACLVAGITLALGIPATGQAQGKITIAGTVGARDYTRQPDSLAKGKFEEYRDMGVGQALPGPRPLFEQLLLRYTPTDNLGLYQLSVRELFQRDQSVWFVADRPGAYDFQVRSDRIPHTFSTTARTPGNELNPGFNTLPIPRPDTLAWRGAPYLSAIRSQWDPTKISLGLTPSEKTDFKAEYTRIDKSGGRPLSMTFNATNGPTREFVEPIDQSVNDFKLSDGYASGERAKDARFSFIKSYQVMAAYGYSLFENNITSTMVDNTQLSVSSPTNGAATSRIALSPNNAAQTGSITGAVSLPMHSRVMGTVTKTWQFQNDPFVPQTSNDSLRGVANYSLVAPLPRASLNGRARTSVVNLSANSHPMDKLTVSARYRAFDYSNQTDSFHVAAMVISDRSINTTDALTSELHPFAKQNKDLSASYRVYEGLQLSAGYAWENWDRDTAVRNVGRTDEKTPRVSLDYNGLGWVSLHGSYSSGTRRGTYTVLDPLETVGFRSFDQADRDRKRTNVMASVSPITNLTVSVDYEVGDDKYPNSLYGTQSDKSTMTGFDVDYSFMSRVNVGFGYAKEDFNNLLDLRYKTGKDTAGSPTWNNQTYNWFNKNTDQDRTTYVNISAVVIPNKLDFGANYSLADSHFWVYNGNPVKPSGGTVSTDSAATTIDFPEVSHRMEPLSFFLSYRYTADWAVTLRYQSEEYTQTDFRTQMPSYYPLTGQIGTIGQVTGTNTGQFHFLGNNYQPYTAKWFTVLISYHPAALPFSRPRSTF